MAGFIKEILKENNKVIKAALKDDKESIVVTEDLYIMFPARYSNVGLLTMKDTISVLTTFIIVNEKNEYAKIIKPAIITTEPSIIDTVTIDGTEYMKFTYHKGSKIVVNKSILKYDGFIFELFREFVIKGNIPWFLNYEDITNLFLEVRKFSGSSISDNPISIQVLTSILARNPNNLPEYIRQSIKDKNDPLLSNIRFIALSNVQDGYNNTMSRLSGAYLKDGIDSVIVRDQTSETQIEKILLS